MVGQLTQSTLSFEQYLLLPYDGRKTEFVDGQIIEMTEPSGLHIEIIYQLGKILEAHFLAESLDLVCRSGSGIEIPRIGKPNNSRDPDLIVCPAEQWKPLIPLTKSIFLVGNAPPLVIEVVSPGTVKIDTRDKRADYADARVPEYWIVNPVEGYVGVWVLDGRIYDCRGEYRGSEVIESVFLPRLKVAASQILDVG